MESPLISVKNVSKTFAGVHALKNIDLDIAPGEIHCLAGENGSGKSTLIKVISGVHEADSGVIEIDGRTWTKLTPLDAIGAGIQVIYQDFSVFPNLTVMENLALTTEAANSSTGRDSGRSLKKPSRRSASPSTWTPRSATCRWPTSSSSPSAAPSCPTRSSS